MKKLLSLILALALVMSMGITAFAAEGDQDGVQTGSYSADVTGSVTTGGNGEAVYSVDIKWSGLSFTYNGGSKVWDAENQKYNITSTDAEGWEESNGKITVTNHSNAAITATPTWNADDDYKDVTMAFAYSNGTDTLELASAETNNAAVEGTITVTPGGTLASTANGNAIGQITIKIESTATVVTTATALIDALATSGSVVLNGDIKKHSSGDYGASFYVQNNASVVLDLNGHSLTSTDGHAIWVSEGSTLTISGGTVIGENYNNCALCCFGTAIINGGTYSGMYSVYVQGTSAVVTINDGEFDDLYALSGGTFIVYGGTFTGDLITNSGSGDGSMTIYGGTFSSNPSKYVADGYEAINNGDGTYTVSAKTE